MAISREKLPCHWRPYQAISVCIDPMRVVLCNHHPILRSELRLLVEREQDIRVLAEASNGPEAVTLTEFFRPDIVLLDLNLPLRAGIIAAREIFTKRRDLGIIFIGTHVDEEYAAEAFRVGARGYVLEDHAETDLVRAIRVVAKDGCFLSPAITQQVLDRHPTLAPEKKKLLCMLGEGYQPQGIEEHLKLSWDAIESDCKAVNLALAHCDLSELIQCFNKP